MRTPFASRFAVALLLATSVGACTETPETPSYTGGFGGAASSSSSGGSGGIGGGTNSSSSTGSGGSGGYVECTTDDECGHAFTCEIRSCKNSKCVDEYAPAGSVADSPFSTPACYKRVCDGKGNDELIVDTSNKPDPYPFDCYRYDCDVDGNKIKVFDPTNVPEDNPGDCRVRECSTDGTLQTVYADDPPAPKDCRSFTCENGDYVAQPINQGMACGQGGALCGSMGYCDACPSAGISCNDTSPASQGHTFATAYDLGKITECGGRYDGVCGVLSTGDIEYFKYTAESNNDFCFFWPSIDVDANSYVTICNYIDCPGTTCPQGASPSTLMGIPGCCRNGLAPSLPVALSCPSAPAYFTIERSFPVCTAYTLKIDE